MVTAGTLALAERSDQDAGSKSQSQSEKEILRLEPGKPIERELAAGESHSYRVTLKSGERVLVSVDQKGIDVVLAVFGPDGQKIIEQDETRPKDSESIYIVADASGDYRLEVRPRNLHATPGMYEVQILDKGQATEGDKRYFDQEKERVKKEFAITSAAEEAWQFYQQGTAESLRKAIRRWEEVLVLVQGDSGTEAWVLYALGRSYSDLGESQRSLEYYERSLSLLRAEGFENSDDGDTLYVMGDLYRRLGEKQKALDCYNRALLYLDEQEDRKRKAATCFRIGELVEGQGELQKAVEHYKQAHKLDQTAGNFEEAARALVGIGRSYRDMGELQKALEYYSQALRLQRAVSDRQAEAVTLTHIGSVYHDLGESQKALEYYTQASQLSRAVDDREQEAVTLNNIGQVYHEIGDRQKALEHYNEALTLARALRDNKKEAATLSSIGRIYYDKGEPQKALEYYNRALPLSRTANDRRVEGATLRDIGAAYASLGKKEQALDHLNQALSLLQEVGDRKGQAATLLEIAYLNRDGDNLSAARARIEAALNIIEPLRTKVASPELRASYLAMNRRFYGFYIDLLIRLHKQRPSEGHDATALQASERARARSLLDSLTEIGAGIRQGVEPKLLERERILQRLINAKAERPPMLPSKEQAVGKVAGTKKGLADLLAQSLSSKPIEEQPVPTGKELDALITEFHELQAQIRATSPRYAALTQPQPLSLKEIQQVLDEDSLLLEYALGEERSFLWAVTTTSITSYVLPKRADIEEAALGVYGLLTARNDQYQKNEERMTALAEADTDFPVIAAELSEMILGPVADQLGKKRLVIVTDGALQYIPFGVLPIPRKESQSTKGKGQKMSSSPSPTGFTPLVVEHEIASLPSASTLAVLRKDLAGRKPAAKTVAVLADPVFDKDDVRVKRAKAQKNEGGQPTESDSSRGLAYELEKSARDVGVAREGLRIPRLLGSRQEANGIAAFAPAGQTMKVLDFKANKATATSAELSEYRIVHFATHGLLNSEHPELSGIVLSLVDEEGKPQDGFLRLHEVYNLNLPADLVVLSACQTALGKEIKGEGLVGLTRGFMYAGAARVVASLWKVDDEATAELMKRFYQGMLKEGQRPAAALRAAQVSMLNEKRWQAPYYWAAFILQGEWK